MRRETERMGLTAKGAKKREEGTVERQGALRILVILSVAKDPSARPQRLS
jgi:hypothetical protein